MLTELDRLKLKDLDIKDVAERLGIEVRQRGNSPCFNAQAHANGDRHPSLAFDPKTNRFKCFACNISGDTIDLVAKVENLDYVEAYKRLAELMGISLTKQERSPRKAGKSRVVQEVKAPTCQPIRINNYCEYEPLPYSEVYQAFYDACEEPNEELKAWWHGRGLSDELLAMAGWRVITPRIWAKIEKMYDESTLLASGLTKQDRGQIKHVFSDAYNVAVPFYNATLETVIGNDPKQVLLIRARCLNSKIANEYGKYHAPIGTSPTLYGYETLYKWASDYPNFKYALMITESETDALACRELCLRKHGDQGYTVALCGGSKNLNSPIVQELVKIVTLENNKSKVKVKVCVDNDDTGKHFFDTVGNALYQAGIPADNIEAFNPWVKLGLKDMGDYLKYLDEHKKL